jgi:23S rRNA (uracil1939-C5)-methyltransferase
MAEHLTLRIEKAVAGGRMLARHDGAIALVAGAIPGELVEVAVEKVQRRTIWASTRRVLEASPDRIDPGSDWACGGSTYSHIRYERQLTLKIDVLRDGFARLAHLELPPDVAVVPSPQDGYRMRARLHLRDGRIGFFREGTHDLCDAGATRQLLPDTVAAVSALARELGRSERVPVTEIDVTENQAATERACHLELVGGANPSQLGLLTPTNGLNGVSCGTAAHSRALTLWGTPTVTDSFQVGPPGSDACAIELRRHARAFFQGNRFLLPRLVSKVIVTLRPGPLVDLYAGVGLFSMAAAACGQTEVTAVEGDRVAAEDLKHNAQAFPGVVHARHQPVESFLSSRSGGGAATTVIVDPPRTGMTRDALGGAIALKPERFVYVSCDVATLARDARLLVDAGYQLTALEGFDLFPNTAHVESVAVFDLTLYPSTAL